MSDNNALALADTYLKEAEALNKASQYQQSIQKLLDAVAIYKKHGVWEKYVKAYNDIGIGYYYLSDYEQAIQSSYIALQMGLEKLGENHNEVATSYSDIGSFYGRIGDHNRALEHLFKALDIFTKLLGEDHTNVGIIYNNIGFYYGKKGDYNNEQKYYQKSLNIRLKNHGEHHPIVATAYNNMGRNCSYKGDYEQAFAFFNKALTIWIAEYGENHKDVANCYTGIAWVHGKKGDHDQQFQYEQKALDIRLKVLVNNHPDIAYSYINLGLCCFKKGNYQEALKHYVKALLINQDKFGNNHIEVARTYHHIGETHAHQKNYDQAFLNHLKALGIRKKSVGEKHPLVARSLFEVGWCISELGNYAKARAHFEQALEIRLAALGENHPDVAHCYSNIGYCYCHEGEYDMALAFHQRALISLIADYTNDNVFDNPTLDNHSSSITLLEVLQDKADTFAQYYEHQPQHIERLEMAFSTFCLADQLIDNIRQGYQAEASKLILAQRAIPIYEKAIATATHLYQVSQDKTYLHKAFSLTEKSKGIALLSALKDAEAKLISDIPESLLAQEKRLSIELTYLDKSIKQENYKGKEADKTLISQWQSEYFAHHQQYAQLIQQLEDEFAEYYHLKYDIHTVSVTALQSILPKKTAILEYFVGEEQLFISCITPTQFSMQVVPKPTDFDEQIEEFTDAINALNQDDFTEYGYSLFQILIAPALNHLNNDIDTLCIIPDGDLAYMPFEALLTQATDYAIPYPNMPYLLLDYDVCYHYSATLLHHVAKRAQKKPPIANNFIGFAPVYADNVRTDSSIQADAPHLNKDKRGAAENTENTLRAITINNKTYRALLYSEEEVQNIEALFKKEGLMSRVFLHEKASSQHFKKAIKGYKYVHIAAHGIYNKQHPELSGILFSPGKDSEHPQEGMLYIGDAYHLAIDADLVVLSCCESGLGQLARGEGMIAINRGFLYAGVANIVFTLFKIYDRDSCLLTTQFFKGILQGKNYTQSLATAKKQLIFKKGITPKSWCGFVLIGK